MGTWVNDMKHGKGLKISENGEVTNIEYKGNVELL